MIEAINHAVHSMTWYIFSKQILLNELDYTLNERWDAEIDVAKINIPYKVLLRRDEAESTEIVFQDGQTTGFLTVQGDGVHLNIAGKNDSDLARYVTEIKNFLVPVPNLDDGKINVKFWYHTNMGPQATTRQIQAPGWEDIRPNYVPEVKTNLDHLMTTFKPAHGGQLILWQGDPGGGKTYALRALCAAWKKWASVDYIVDPDAFFGGSPSYLMQVISSEHDGEEIEWDIDNHPIVLEDRRQSKWKLLILEDSGDFLAMDAREKTGQALSRLLNVADGFIGQGLKIILMITTNDDIGRLHPAVSRPGRSAAITEFKKFTYPEALEWAKHNNLVLPRNQAYSLAELYSLVGGFDNHVDVKRKEFGFVPLSGRA